jgi:hypothetical protein
MIACECAQEQARELVADRLAKADGGRRRSVLDPVQASAMLEDECESSVGLDRGGVRDPNIGHGPPPGDPSPE